MVACGHERMREGDDECGPEGQFFEPRCDSNTLLRQALHHLRDLAVGKRRLEVAAGADHQAGELAHGQRTPWAVRIGQVPPPDPSPRYAAVLRFCWRRTVLRKLLLGIFSALTKLRYFLQQLGDALVFPARIGIGYLRLLESQRQALPDDGAGLGIPQRGEQAAQRGE